jgi:hypothetical protein
MAAGLGDRAVRILGEPWFVDRAPHHDRQDGDRRQPLLHASTPSFSRTRCKSSFPRYSITILPFLAVCMMATRAPR